MTNLEKHHFFLAKKDFEIYCSLIIFTLTEINILKKYGNWLQALAYGDILPVSDAQEQFIKVSQKQAQPQSEIEWAWYKYKTRLSLEIKHGNKLKQQYKFVDDSFFCREDYWKLRRNLKWRMIDIGK